MQSEIHTTPQAPPKITKKPRKFPWRGIGILLCTFAVVLMILAGGYGYSRLVQVNIFLANAYAHFERQLASQQTQINTLQTNLNNAEKTDKELQTTVESQAQILTEWRNKQQNPQLNWSMLEAQYLTKIAQDNLLFNRNIPVAVAALKSADQLLQKLQDPSVEPIRKALITDIDTLQSANTVDSTGLYLRLSVLDKKIDALPLRYEPKTSTVAMQELPTQSETKWWQRGLQTTWHSLQQLVQVRYNPPNSLPFILPDQKAYLYQNIHVQLQNAMWAVLNQNDAVYKNSLTQAEAWLRQYFSADTNDTQYLLNELSELQKINLQSSVPAVSASVQAFHNYFAQPTVSTTS